MNNVLELPPTPTVSNTRSKPAIWESDWLLVGLIVVTAFVRLATAPTYVESRDGLFFLRGLNHYSVAQLSPHWPGYPVYIWLGELARLLTGGDGTKGFHLLSALASSLAIWPLAALTKSWWRALGREGAGFVGLAAGLLWALAPLSWQGGTEIFSDPLGMLLALTGLWLAWLALEQPEQAALWLPIAGALGGLMLGTRLSYVTLLLPLAYITLKLRRQPVLGRSWRGLALPLTVAASFGATIALWFGWQLLIEGWEVVSAGQRHLAGHYSEWGGSAATDQHWLTRPARFLETNVVYGLGGWWPDADLSRLPVTLGWLALLGLGVYRLVRSPLREVAITTGLWAIPYALWILLGNDVDLNRYDFPLMACACWLAALGLPAKMRLAAPALLAMVAALAIVSVPIGIEHRDSLPIGQRLVKYTTTQLNPASSTVVVSENTSPLIFFLLDEAPGYQSVGVLNADLPNKLAELEKQGRQVYITALANTPPGPDWSPVARLCRSRYQESRGPLEVWLYQHLAAGQVVQPAPAQCF